MNAYELAKKLCDLAWDNGWVLTYKLERKKCCDDPRLSSIDVIPAIIYCGNCKQSYVDE
jgi:hypothetical protein